MHQNLVGVPGKGNPSAALMEILMITHVWQNAGRITADFIQLNFKLKLIFQALMYVHFNKKV